MIEKLIQIPPRNKIKQPRQVPIINKWQFDKAAAENFSTIARREIPDYQRVIDLSVQIIKRLDIRDPKIIDVGSAIGTTLHTLHQAGFSNIYGVDSSADMLARSFDKATLIQAEDFPVEHGPFDVVIANWVLHFIRDRESYLQAIKNSLTDAGVLILTEKVSGSSLANELYYDFKRRNGVTEEEIEEKKRRLEGVLSTYPLAWYLAILDKLGFKQVEIINANTVFISLLARRA